MHRLNKYTSYIRLITLKKIENYQIKSYILLPFYDFLVFEFENCNLFASNHS